MLSRVFCSALKKIFFSPFSRFDVQNKPDYVREQRGAFFPLPLLCADVTHRKASAKKVLYINAG